MDICTSDPSISRDNSSLPHGQVQTVHLVQRIGICHCLPHIYLHQQKWEVLSNKIALHHRSTLQFCNKSEVAYGSLELHMGCPWDSLCINWRGVTLTNGNVNIRLPYNVQVPMREKYRLHSLMRGPDCTAHLMVLQGCTWYTVNTTPLHYTAVEQPFSPGSMNSLPPSSDDSTTWGKAHPWFLTFLLLKYYYTLLTSTDGDSLLSTPNITE